MTKYFWLRKITFCIFILQLSLFSSFFSFSAHAQDSAAEEATSAAPMAPEVREALDQLRRCGNMPLCPANLVQSAAPYRTSACTLTPRQSEVLREYFSTHSNWRLGRAANLAFHASGINLVPALVSSYVVFIYVALFGGFSPNSMGAMDPIGGAFAAASIFRSFIWTPREFSAFYNQFGNQLRAEGYNPQQIRSLWRDINRRPTTKFIAHVINQIKQRLAGLRTTPRNATPPTTGVRVDVVVRDDGNGNPCVTEASATAVGNAAADAIEVAAAEEQAAANTPPVANQNRVTTAMTSHMCSAERVQQYAQSLAVDRATRWHEFLRRQQRDEALMQAVDIDRFNRAQRQEVLRGSIAAAGAVASAVVICGSGGTATPLVGIAQQIMTRSITATALVALTAGTISVFPADASAQELRGTQSCGPNATRVSLPQTSGTAGYMGIPANLVVERLSPVASYDPARIPRCWAPIAPTCAALRQEFTIHNIVRLTPSICGTTVASGETTGGVPLNLTPPSSSIGAH